MSESWVFWFGVSEFFTTFGYLYCTCMMLASLQLDGIFNYQWALSAAYGGAKTVRLGVECSMLVNLVPYVLVYRYGTTRLGRLKIIWSVTCQLLGAVAGSALALLIQGSDLMENTLAQPVSNKNGWAIATNEFIFTFILSFCDLLLHRNSMDDAAAETDTPAPMRSPSLIDERAITAASLAVVYYIGLQVTASSTNGCFILTRVLGPAIVLWDWSYAGFYVLGQVLAHVASSLVIYLIYYNHA